MMMMTKRRQTLGIQILAAVAILGFVAFLFFPETPSNIKLAADNWYDESNQVNQQMAAAAAAAAGLMNIQLQQQQHQEQHQIIAKPDPNRVKAAFVILARNSDINGIRFSIRQIEDRFNRKFNYPYVFLNEEHFTEEFKAKTSALTNAQTHYGKVDSDMWGYPDFINQTHAAECRKAMEEKKIIYGGSESYRHMCR
jgi:hypothetical protein